jgi:hypothetical protein
LCVHATCSEIIESAWQTIEQYVGYVGSSFLDMCQKWQHFECYLVGTSGVTC